MTHLSINKDGAALGTASVYGKAPSTSKLDGHKLAQLLT